MSVEMWLFIVAGMIVLAVSYYKNWRHVFALVVSMTFLAGLFFIESIFPSQGLFGSIFILMVLGNFTYLIFVAYASYTIKNLSELFSDLIFSALRGGFALTICAVGMTFVISTMIYIFWPNSWGKIGELSISAAWIGIKTCGISMIFSVVLSIAYFIIEMIFETKPCIHKMASSNTTTASTQQYYEKFPVSGCSFSSENNSMHTSDKSAIRTYDYKSHLKEAEGYNPLTYQKVTNNSHSLSNRKIYRDVKRQSPQTIPVSLISQKFTQLDIFLKNPVVVIIVVALFFYDVSQWNIFKFVGFGNKDVNYSRLLNDDFQRLIKSEDRNTKNSLRGIADIIVSKQVRSYKGYRDAVFILRENRCKASVSLAMAGLCFHRDGVIKKDLLHTIAILTAQQELLEYVSKKNVDELGKQWLTNKKPVKYEEMSTEQIFTTVQIFAKVNDIYFGKEAIYSYIFATSDFDNSAKKRRRGVGKRRRRNSVQRVEKSIEPFLWKSLEDDETFVYALACLELYHKQHSLYLDDIVNDVKRSNIQRLAALMIYWRSYKVTDVDIVILILNQAQTRHLLHLTLLFLGVSSDEKAVAAVTEYISHSDVYVRRGAAYASLQHRSFENLARYLREKKYEHQDQIFLNGLRKMNPGVAEQVIAEKLQKAVVEKSKKQALILYATFKTMVQHKLKKQKSEKRRKYVGDVYENIRKLLNEWETIQSNKK